MSSNFDVGLSFYFMSKNGELFTIFATKFSRFHKMKTRAQIKNLRHGSL